MVSKAMQDAGYDIIPINPTIDEALGVKAVASLKDIKSLLISSMSLDVLSFA